MSTGLSGMRAAWSAMEAHASNIANVETPGYRRVVASDVAQAGGGVDTRVARAASPGAAPADDLVGMLAAKDSFAANLSVFKRGDEALGSLLDAVG